MRCGDIMKLYIKVGDNEIIEDIKFQTFGCGAAIATSSMITEIVKGMPVDEAENVQPPSGGRARRFAAGQDALPISPPMPEGSHSQLSRK